jgi:glutamyl-tRNA reductase
MKEDKKLLQNFWVAGISYKNSDAPTRGKFAVNHDQYEATLAAAASFNINEVFILSTCNRTEIYGFCEDIHDLINLLCCKTAGDATHFKAIAYIKNGKHAMTHLYHVASGLDSQLLGDYEIIGQLKGATNFAKERGFVGTFTERILNGAVQSAKAVKNNTGLSTGTVSVSFAAIQCIRERMPDFKDKKILVVGTGKIGRNTCKNLVDYLETKSITLVNRTAEKAQVLAEELGLQFAAVSMLPQLVNDADIIITSATTTAPIIYKNQFHTTTNKLLIDIAIPSNIDANVSELPNIQLINVDELSKIKDETIQKRKAEVPHAVALVQEQLDDFYVWYEMRKNVPMLLAIKNTLIEIQARKMKTAKASTTQNTNDEAHLKKVMNATAVKLKTQNNRGCNYIQAINEYIA